MLEFNEKYEIFLNNDPELQRRLKGFKAFSGLPDGHYKRARDQGISAVARAVKCYPFGGESQFGNDELIGIDIKGVKKGGKFVIALKDGQFTIKSGNWKKPHLTVALSAELFKKTVLGRYRWLWTIGMDEVEIAYSETLPHSDWVTLLEVLVAMQELVEFDKGLWEKIEKL
jgi:hypothetical protein